MKELLPNELTIISGAGDALDKLTENVAWGAGIGAAMGATAGSIGGPLGSGAGAVSGAASGAVWGVIGGATQTLMQEAGQHFPLQYPAGTSFPSFPMGPTWMGGGNGSGNDNPTPTCPKGSGFPPHCLTW
ncbi:hypothetical protein [Xenorhabdus bovienii]|uniref:hypothetical protein n=1 Tax=Xenorhabdus bovienii TaxID=40576 RepID=UPI0023B25D9B|nr:hypothetical protein [Xenorhabdus bovienii]MDE9459192.1 hypothetical protein [Xenorhabdus bovienii]MDE9487314.1 hypothetical protein [Xenorhabdus bovienii]MDE9515384.1 hypothetical protein [Xenorhabdus bovienii]